MCTETIKNIELDIDKDITDSITSMSPAKLSVKDVYERLCANRDREIELVWKRAVFLTAFLIACFTAYGGLLAAYIGNSDPKNAPFAVISVAAIGISFVGILLSIVWIQMAKGSKAWYEHYENVIECFVKNHSSGDLDMFAKGDYRSLLYCPASDNGETKVFHRLRTSPLNDCLLSTAGGRVSVSKIVIVLGQLFLGIWMSILCAHTLYLFFHLTDFGNQLKGFFDISSLDSMGYTWVWGIALFLGLLGIAFIIFRFARGCSIRSGYFNGVVCLRKCAKCGTPQPQGKNTMTNEQLIHIKEAFKNLERLLESSNTVTDLFKGNPTFEEAFSTAMKGLGIIENEWILEIPGTFNSRDAIESALEKIEIIESYVKQGIIPQSGSSLEERLTSAKALLKEANNHLNGKQ